MKKLSVTTYYRNKISLLTQALQLLCVKTTIKYRENTLFSSNSYLYFYPRGLFITLL
nr:hypothetical protein [Mucilaginibacter sp. SP1R1]